MAWAFTLIVIFFNVALKVDEPRNISQIVCLYTSTQGRSGDWSFDYRQRRGAL